MRARQKRDRRIAWAATSAIWAAMGSQAGQVGQAAPPPGPHVVMDGTLGKAGPLTPTLGNYSITPDLGQQKGGNLFQSFTRLDLTVGESATFSGPASVQNVIARVTGGVQSSIDGALRCTIPDANFYLVNPSGVVFGPNSKLDVKGSFAVTTAGVIKLADGGQLNAVSPSSSVLSTAAPAAFGFLTPNAAGVSLQNLGNKQSTLNVPPGKVLSIVSGPITSTGSQLTAPGGRVNLIAVASTTDVTFDATSLSATVTIPSSVTRADVSFANSIISTDGNGGGQVTVRSNNLTLQDSSMTARSTGSQNGLGIDIDAVAQFNLTRSLIDTTTTGTGSAGPINISAGTIAISASTNFVGGQNISAASITANSGPLTSGSGPYGAAGAVTLSASSVAVTQDVEDSLQSAGVVFLAGSTVLVRAGTITLNTFPARLTMNGDGTFGFADASQIGTDGTLGSALTLTGPVYDVPASLGKVVGNNLFQSFSMLSVGQGDTIQFDGPTGGVQINNVIARVTGGAVSVIDGTVTCEIPGANLFLINPAGIVFGEFAQLNVGGSFAATTANLINFSDGGTFSAAAPASSVLSAAAPTAFGFSNAMPGAISVLTSAPLSAASGQSLSLVGGAVTLANTGMSAPDGRINLVGAAGPGDVPIASAVNSPLILSSSLPLAPVSITASTLDVGGGRLSLRGSDINVQGSQITAIASDQAGGGVDVVASGTFSLIGSGLQSGTSSSSTGGSVSINAATVIIDGRGVDNVDSFIGISANSTDVGQPGNVSIQAASVQVFDGATVSAVGTVSGATGNIQVNAPAISFDGLPGGFSVTAGVAQFFRQGNLTLDSTLGTPGPLSGPNYVIPSSAGQQVGSILFESFSDFVLGAGQSATFNGPSSVSDILVRVTGGRPANIDGTLSSGMNNANLFIIDPAGIIIGPNAVLSLNGALILTTADALQLGSTAAGMVSGRFDASAPASSVLVAAAPSAFEFVATKPASISFTVPLALTNLNLSLIGGDLSVTSPPNPAGTAGGSVGQFNLISVASPGAVVFDPTQSAAPDIHAIAQFGNIVIGQASSTGSTPLASAGLLVRGNNLAIVDTPFGLNDSADVALTGNLTLQSSTIAGGAGLLRFAATGAVSLTPDSAILGGSGGIQIVAGSLSLGQDASTMATLTANGGDINVKVTTLNAASPLSQQIGSAPAAISGSNVSIAGLVHVVVNGQPLAGTGSLVVDGTLSGTTAGPLSGYDYLVPASAGTLLGTNLFESFSSFNIALGERVTFAVPDAVQNLLVRVTGGPAQIDGLLRLNTTDSPAVPSNANLFFIDPAGIQFGTGADVSLNGAFVAATANSLRFSDGGSFNALSPASSSLTSAAPATLVFGLNPAAITLAGTPANATTGTGRMPVIINSGGNVSLIGGSVTITTADLSQADQGSCAIFAVGSSSQLGLDPTQPGLPLSTGLLAGAGNVSMSDLNNDMLFSAPNLIVRANNLSFTNVMASTVDIQAAGQFGDAGGSIGGSISAPSIVLTGAQLTGPDIQAGNLTAMTGTIISGGNIAVTNQFTLSGGSQLSTTGGAIQVTAGNVLISSSSISSFASGANNGGNITLSLPAGTLQLTGPSSVSSMNQDGAAGNISITAANVVLDPTMPLATAIYSHTNGAGQAGNITISAGSVTGFNPITFQIYSTSSGTGTAGAVTLNGSTLTSTGPGSVGLVLDNSLGGSGLTFNGGNYMIPASAGQVASGNLFESFTRFDLGPGQSATFAGPSGVANVLVRVTGTTPANIDGNINCTINGANFFLIDPNGIVLGPEASLNVPGAVAFSTANALSLSGGGQFNATLSAVPLSGGSPSGFVFTAASPAGIAVLGYGPDPTQISLSAVPLGTPLSVLAGQALSLVGGDISINGRDVTALGGRVNLVSVASPGTAAFDPTSTNPFIDVSSFAQLGQVAISGGTFVDASDHFNSSTNLVDAGGGSIGVAGGSMNLTNALLLQMTDANTPGGGINISLSGNLNISGGGSIQTAPSFNFSPGTGQGGNISISAMNATITAGTFNPALATNIPDGVFETGGNPSTPGSISILCSGQLTVSGPPALSAPPPGIRTTGGTMELFADTITLSSADLSAFPLTSTLGGNLLTGGGSILLSAPTINISSHTTITAAASTFTATQNPGNIEIDATNLSISGGSSISTAQFGSGVAGTISLTATQALSLADSGTSVVSTTGAGEFDGHFTTSQIVGGTAGAITITTPALSLTGGASISTSAVGGTGGTITLNCGTVVMNGPGTSISADTAPSFVLSSNEGAPTNVFFLVPGGQGGSIQITAQSLQISNGAIISAATTGGGDAGSINLSAQTFALSNATISASSSSLGNAGAIAVTGGAMTLSGGSSIGSSSVDAGNAGSITLQSTGQITIDGGTSLAATSLKSTGGDVAVSSTTAISLTGGSTISAAAVQAGSVTLSAPTITLSGSSVSTDTIAQTTGPTPDVSISANTLNITNSQISAQTTGTGVGGNVTISPLSPGLLTLSLSGSSVSANTSGAGAGGNISISGTSLTFADGSISSSSTGSGAAGSVTIMARKSVTLDGSSSLDATSAQSAGGDISVTARKIRVNGGSITTSTPDTGGIITLDAHAIDLFSRATISAAAGNDGNISLLAPGGTLFIQDSLVTARASGTGGGKIFIDPTLVILEGATLNGLSAGRPVQVVFDPSVVLLRSQSQILTDALILPPQTDVSGALLALPSALPQINLGLAPVCAPRLDADFSSFVITGEGGRPPQPGGWVPDLQLQDQ